MKKEKTQDEMDELHRYARVDNQILFDSDYFRKSA